MASLKKQPVDPTRLRALILLATIPDGVIEDLLVFAHRFDRALIAGLITEGFATARNVLGPGRATIGVHIKISDAGMEGA